MEERARWTLGIAPVAVGLAFAAVSIAVVRFSDVPATPWLYIGVTVGIVSALGGLILAMARAKEWSD